MENIKNNKPSSLCTLSTKESIKDLLLLLESLNYINFCKNIYIVCDTFTENYINSTIQKYKYKIVLLNKLDKYENINLGIQFDNMHKKKWTEFMLEKTVAINIALDENSDTLFVDSDLLFINDLPDIDYNYELGLCKHNILETIENKYGKYNGGSLWINSKKFSSWWIENTWADTTKYMEQQCLDLAPDNFKTFLFDNTHNFGWWRLQSNNPDEIKNRRRKFKFVNNITYYNKNPLISIHTHFFDTTSRQVCLFNKFLLDYLNNDIKNIIKSINNVEITKNNYELIASNTFYCKSTIIYPPFANGYFLEEYFFNYMINNGIKHNKNGKKYIPALWTNFQNQLWFMKDKIFLQQFIDKWIENNKCSNGYFIVIQHDDGPQLILPKNTIIYGSCMGDIPLPLIYEDKKMILETVQKKKI